MPRKNLDGQKLAADVARLLDADAQSPPEARPSLMDAMRSLVRYIDARARLGWTDPMIARVLTEAGYPIGAATLRSYRKRMRDEGLSDRRDRKGPSPPVPAAPAAQPVPATPFVPPIEPHRTDAEPGVAQAGKQEPTPPSAKPEPAQSLGGRRTFTVDRSIRPPDRA